MAVMSSPSKDSFNKILSQLKTDYPDIKFIKSDNFRCNAEKKVVFFSTKSEKPVWSLLHELGHINLAHQDYRSDVSLLRMEVEAWQKAKQLGEHYGHHINEDYIQDCIDSYRDWLHRRSTCPACKQTGVEKMPGAYICLNCQAVWEVGRDRFCRVYRKTKSLDQAEAL